MVKMTFTGIQKTQFTNIEKTQDRVYLGDSRVYLVESCERDRLVELLRKEGFRICQGNVIDERKGRTSICGYSDWVFSKEIEKNEIHTGWSYPIMVTIGLRLEKVLDEYITEQNKGDDSPLEQGG